jgi:hypothetical protein
MVEQTAPQTRKPRRKRFKVRIARVEYIDVEVLAYTQEQANDDADTLGWGHWNTRGPGTHYTEQSECYILNGPEIERITLPPFTLFEGDVPLDLARDDWGSFREEYYDEISGVYRLR